MENAQRPALHFVGFRDDRYWNAVRVWGPPSFIHFRWDKRAQRDIYVGDIVVFATGDENQPLSQWNGPDLFEVD